jgi:hypothetical protein
MICNFCWSLYTNNGFEGRHHKFLMNFSVYSQEDFHQQV